MNAIHTRRNVSLRTAPRSPCSIAHDRNYDGPRQFAEPIVESSHGLGITLLQLARQLFIRLAAHLQSKQTSVHVSDDEHSARDRTAHER